MTVHCLLGLPNPEPMRGPAAKCGRSSLVACDQHALRVTPDPARMRSTRSSAAAQPCGRHPTDLFQGVLMTAVTSTIPRVRRRPITSQLPAFAAALEEQRRFRIEQLSELAADAVADSSVAMDDPRSEVSAALSAAARNALFEIEAAVDRIDAGTYGLCERCAMEISEERLEIVPMTRLCMRCAHAREQRAR
jgi:RNA polymerase-binding transcription factor DksA